MFQNANIGYKVIKKRKKGTNYQNLSWWSRCQKGICAWKETSKYFCYIGKNKTQKTSKQPKKTEKALPVFQDCYILKDKT